MLTNIGIRNLTVFNQSKFNITLNKETILVGRNNTGKSTIFSAIAMIRNLILNGRIDYATSLYDLRSFYSAVHLHDETREIKISLSFNDSTNYNLTFGKYKFNFEFFEGSQSVARSASLLNPSRETKEKFCNIWFIHAHRSLIPYLQEVGSTSSIDQPLHPKGDNLLQFISEKLSDKDDKSEYFESWIKRFGVDVSAIKTPLREKNIHLATVNEYDNDTGKKIPVNINLSLQGTGIQNLLTILTGVIYSPKTSTICIEEPENFLHPSWQELLLDFFNEVIEKEDKQIIFSTHSWDLLLPIIKDVNPNMEKSKRGSTHTPTNHSNLITWFFSEKAKCSQYDLTKNKYSDIRRDLHGIL